MAIRVNKKVLLFVVSLVVIFAQYIKIVDFNYYNQFIIAMVWIVYDYLNIFFAKKKLNSEEKFFEKIFLLPWCIITIYTFIVFFIGNTENVPIVTYIGANLTIIITILFAFSAVHIFKEYVLNYSIIALAIIYFIVSIKAIVTQGPLVFLNKIIEIFQNFNSNNNPFEISDCTFAAGLVFLVYYFYGKKRTKKEKKYMFIFSVFILLGLKRIQILSLMSAVLIGWIVKRIKSRNLKNIFMNCVSGAFIFVSSAFVFFISSDFNLLNWTSLDMGRYHLYSFINDYFDFNIGYLGHGYGFSNKFVEMNTMYSITVLHSDIIRMYVEIGFLGFYAWMVYYLIVVRKRIEKRYNVNYASVYFFVIVYLFVTYFTDNTVNYFVTQYFCCILVATLGIGSSFFGNISEYEEVVEGKL